MIGSITSECPPVTDLEILVVIGLVFCFGSFLGFCAGVATVKKP